MTKEELENILKLEIQEETLDEIYSQLNNMVNEYKKISYNKKIEIIYRDRISAHTEEKYLNNACARNIGDNKYEIYICPLLIKDLYRFACLIAGYKGFKLDSSNKIRNILIKQLIYYWLYFIIFHEYIHIIRGHVDYNIISRKNESTIYEFIDLKCLSKEDLIISQGMEFQADEGATLLLFKNFLTEKSSIKNQYNINYTDNDLIFDYFLGMNFLFFFFDARSKNISSSHPLAKERVIFFNDSIMRYFKEMGKINADAYLEYIKYTNKKEIEVENIMKSFVQKMESFEKKNIEKLFEPYKFIPIQNISTMY